MIDEVVVFSTTGVVLWTRTFSATRGDPINSLIRDVLLQERGGRDEFMYDSYRVRWVSDNKRGIYYVAVCQSFVPVEGTDRVLALLEEEFGKQYPETGDFVSLFAQPVDFDEAFDTLQLQAEAQTELHKRRRRTMRNSYASPSAEGTPGKKRKNKKKKKRGRGGNGGAGDDGDDADPPSAGSEEEEAGGADERKAGDDNAGSGDDDGTVAADDEAAPPRPDVPPPRPGVASRRTGASPAGGSGGEDSGSDGEDDGEDGSGGGGSSSGMTHAERVKAKLARLRGRGRGRRGAGSPARRTAAPAAAPRQRAPRNRNRQSDRIRKTATAQDMAALDRSGPQSSEDARRVAARRMAMEAEAAKLEEEEKEAAKTEDTASGSWFASSAIGGFFQKLAGNKVLDDEDIAPVMERMKEQLLGKNVASEVADQLCKSVGSSLIGQRLERLTRVATVVRTAMQDSLERILTAKRSTDVLAAVRSKKAAGGGPYVVVFIGVNGVGKSTSLAKVCSFLKRNGHSVLIAACDTFRSGAVEQLRTHSDALQVDLFARGYNKDPAMIAKAAVKQAGEEGTDVVLIDTAGRMQNNEPLMRALAKLVAVNRPDLVLFVGEALVGNDGVDQLQYFNQALIDNTDPVRSVDGIVLTKYDTIDDKVGAAVSMVYKTGQPIVFVGTGQHYSSLKRLDVAEVVRQLCT